MPTVIRVSPEVYARLEKHAHGFNTPSDVIEHLLNKVEDIEANPERPLPCAGNSQRDTTKYLFEGQKYGKNRLVHAIVRSYVQRHPECTAAQLAKIFPKRLQGPAGVFDTIQNAQAIIKRGGYKRHFVELDEQIHVADNVIAVCTQWGIFNIDHFIAVASKLGFKIAPHVPSAPKASSSNHEVQEEINKVSRRLELRAMPDHQSKYNVRILNAFLELRRAGKQTITKEEINTKLGLKPWFWTNFTQMKTIAKKNHGKVFEVSGSNVTIWQPVLAAVKAYEEQVFALRNV